METELTCSLVLLCSALLLFFQSMLNSLMSFFKENEEVPQVETHWMSESGIIDVFVMLGPKPHDVFEEYASFTGTTALPPVSVWKLFFKVVPSRCQGLCHGD